MYNPTTLIIYPPSAKVISSNIDKIIPGESKSIKSPRSCRDIQRKYFINDIRNSTFLQKKTSNKYNKKAYTYKSKRKSKQKR